MWFELDSLLVNPNYSYVFAFLQISVLFSNSLNKKNTYKVKKNKKNLSAPMNPSSSIEFISKFK